MDDVALVDELQRVNEQRRVVASRVDVEGAELADLLRQLSVAGVLENEVCGQFRRYKFNSQTDVRSAKVL